jgi:two-component system, response regulator PdtaR
MRPGAPRWRVLVVDDDLPSRAALTAAITEEGGVVAGQSESAASAPALAASIRPDVALFAVGLRDGDGVTAAAAVMATAPCPIVLVTGHRGAALIERARRAGVMAYLLKPLRSEELPPALDLAIARFGEIQELRERLAARKVIERAKGVLMARRGCTEEAAFRSLRSTAMNQRRPLADIARAVLAAESAAHPER